MSRGELLALVSAQAKMIEALTQRVAELERRLGQDSSNSSRPSSSDAPWAKQPAKKRSSRVRSGRKPGKQPGAASSSRSLDDDPDVRLEIEPGRCGSCDVSLDGAEECGRQRRQVVDIRLVPPPKVTEYQRVSKVCPCCGTVTTPGWDDAAVPVEHADVVAAHGSPVRIGPEALVRAALLTCAHFLPVGRARDLLAKLCAIEVSTGFLAGIRGRAARRLEKKFLSHMCTLLATAPVVHADETPAEPPAGIGMSAIPIIPGQRAILLSRHTLGNNPRGGSKLRARQMHCVLRNVVWRRNSPYRKI